MEDCLKCQINPLVKYRPKNTIYWLMRLFEPIPRVVYSWNLQTFLVLLLHLLMKSYHLVSFIYNRILKLKIFIGMSTKLIANGHVQIYKYTEYGQWPKKSFEHNAKYNYDTFIHTHKKIKLHNNSTCIQL